MCTYVYICVYVCLYIYIYTCVTQTLSMCAKGGIAQSASLDCAILILHYFILCYIPLYCYVRVYYHMLYTTLYVILAPALFK